MLRLYSCDFPQTILFDTRLCVSRVVQAQGKVTLQHDELYFPTFAAVCRGAELDRVTSRTIKWEKIAMMKAGEDANTGRVTSRKFVTQRGATAGGELCRRRARDGTQRRTEGMTDATDSPGFLILKNADKSRQ